MSIIEKAMSKRKVDDRQRLLNIHADLHQYMTKQFNSVKDDMESCMNDFKEQGKRSPTEVRRAWGKIVRTLEYRKEILDALKREQRAKEQLPPGQARL